MDLPQPGNDAVVQSASRRDAPQSPPDGMVDPPAFAGKPAGRKKQTIWLRVLIKQPRRTSLYLTSTVAPASVNFFLMASASSLFTPSLMGFGAPSTRSLASFKPRLVTSRTALITLILLAPMPVSTTVNSVFSSTGGAAGPAAAPATTTGAAAAAETPRVSSSFFTSSAASSRVRPLISSTILSILSDIALLSS